MAKKSKEKTQKTTAVPVIAEPSEERFRTLNKLIRRRFFKPDLQAFRVTMGAIQAHRLDTGDPPWLFAIAPPSTGKTSMTIMGSAALSGVFCLGGLTPSTLLSGYIGQKLPGLLEKLGATAEKDGVITTTGNAVLLIKDFTTVLSMRRETRSEILSQLREIHDGEFTKSFGTGQTKRWRGRLCIIAAVTPEIDHYSSVFITLGERFLKVRWHRPESPRSGQRAIRQQGEEAIIRQQIQQAVQQVFDGATSLVPELDAIAAKRLAYAAELVAIARTHVRRSSYGGRGIESISEAEGNMRIAKELAAIARGVASLRGRSRVEESDLQDAFRVALDSLPVNRRNLLVSIAREKSPDSVTLPRTIKNRELEELEALELITSAKGPRLTPKARGLLRIAAIDLDPNEADTKRPNKNMQSSNKVQIDTLKQ